MQGVTVTRKTTIQLDLDADGWALYGLEGREFAAYSLNHQMESAINEATDLRQAYTAADRVLDNHRTFGASDTEGRYVAHRIIALAFPEATA